LEPEANGSGAEFDLSFVIPSLNEEQHIGQTLADIARHLPHGLTAEVIVVDHGSVDRTREIAANSGAIVLCHPEVSLGELRNRGASIARGRILVFVDADVSLTREWQANIGSIVANLSEGANIVTGSRTEYAHSEHWAQRGFGMQTTVDGEVPYLGTAHLIVSRSAFAEIGGFPSDRDTGEDEAFGRRAWDRGVRVVADPRLRAIHRGAPATAMGFFLRQLWHGLGDARSLNGFLRSPTALAGVGFVICSLAIMLALSPVRIVPRVVAVVGAASVLGIITIKAWTRRRNLRARDLPATYGAFFLFFLARGLAPFARLILGQGRRPSARR
jgi:hypothetical protein